MVVATGPVNTKTVRSATTNESRFMRIIHNIHNKRVLYCIMHIMCSLQYHSTQTDQVILLYYDVPVASVGVNN